jgi:hypothetical protein
VNHGDESAASRFFVSARSCSTSFGSVERTTTRNPDSTAHELDASVDIAHLRARSLDRHRAVTQLFVERVGGRRRDRLRGRRRRIARARGEREQDE